jgi:small ligand-binding sensory domain FIST
MLSALRSPPWMSVPRFASALSTETDSGRAIRAALDGLEAGLDGRTPDLVTAFATHHHGPALEGLGPAVSRATGAHTILGCTAESVIGAAQEIEGRPGLALWAACLPDTEVRYFEVTARNGADGEPSFSALPAPQDAEHSCLLLLADPYTFPVDCYLGQLNESLPGVPAMGGMSSGAMGPGQTLFFTADGVRESGAVGVVLEGAIALHPVVSQGCRPIGKPWVVTECDRNLIKKLGGRSAIEVLMETFNELSAEDRKKLQSSPFLGLAVDAARTKFTRGDFLVRGIIGLNHRDRTIAVGDFVRRGQTVQLLVRDAESAGEDLRQLLASQGGGALRSEERGSAGALIFSCNGRGTRMFSTPHHDACCVRDGMEAELPVAGFFAAGEIGPVGKRNFLHGFTASVALFRPRSGP